MFLHQMLLLQQLWFVFLKNLNTYYSSNITLFIIRVDKQVESSIEVNDIHVYIVVFMMVSE